MAKIYIDGNAGTTGLRIVQRLAQRSDLELLRLPEHLRKDPQAKIEIMREAQIVFLCVPDAAAKQSAALIQQLETTEQPVVIDASTAHRTHPEWVYGLPELKGQAQKIKSAQRIANPGCHATGFITLIKPLIDEKVLNPETVISCTSITGYSGGGKAMIAQYQEYNAVSKAGDETDNLLCAPRMYGLTQEHKHLPEMKALTGLHTTPAFMPIVANYYAGMEVIIPLHASFFEKNTTISDLQHIYQAYYPQDSENLIRIAQADDESGFFSAAKYAGRDDLVITVHGNNQRPILTARFDNLGKGASGSAIQNMNLVLGLPAATGLNIGEGN